MTGFAMGRGDETFGAKLHGYILWGYIRNSVESFDANTQTTHFFQELCLFGSKTHILLVDRQIIQHAYDDKQVCKAYVRQDFCLPWGNFCVQPNNDRF